MNDSNPDAGIVLLCTVGQDAYGTAASALINVPFLGQALINS